MTRPETRTPAIEPPPPRRSVRMFLLQLVLACLVPGIVGAALLFVHEYRDGREQLEKSTLQTARALVRAVDGHLLVAQATVQTLASAESLASGDLARFHQRARAVAAEVGAGSNFVLSAGDGRQLLNTAREFGADLPRHPKLEQVRQVFATGRPSISDLFFGPVLGSHAVSIDVPVQQGGKAAYVLGIGMLPGQFLGILQQQRLPAGWVAGVFDRTGTIVARTHAHERLVGQKGIPELLARMRESSEGIFETVTHDGFAVYLIYSRSPVTGWTIAIGIPRHELEAELKRTIALLALGIAALFAIGLGLAWMTGGRIARSVRSLIGPARALGAGEPVPVGQTGIAEADEVARAMREAAALLQARTAALQAAKVEAERANEAKSRFLAAASHDLRQPLAALSLYVGALRNHVIPGGQPLLANLKDCIGSLSGLLGDLLDLSRLQAGVVRPEAADFDLGGTLAGLVALYRPEAQLKGLELRCRPGRLTAHTDPALFRQILGKLIDNAVRYTRHGGVLVACRRHRGKTWVEVWDTGIGIPEHETAAIFEEFRQLGDQARTRGSGLGLTIAAKTASLLGLEIRVRSRPGKGSLFAVEFPPGGAAVEAAPAPRAAPGRSLYVALVEDNAMVRQALAIALQAAGHRVVTAATAAELRAVLAGRAPDVVVADYRLAGGETGFEAIRSVRATFAAELPAILLTGDTDPGLVRSMADRGVTVLHKPVNVETLQASLKDLTERGETVS